MSKETATKTKSEVSNQEQPQQDRQRVAVLQPPRLPYHPIYEQRYGIDGIQWRALVEAVYPSAKTPEGIILAVSYCKAMGYDVMKKMVHVVPIWNSALQKEVEGIWEGVSALRATAFRTNEYAGCDETKFGPMKTQTFSGEVGRGQYAKQVEVTLEFPEWAQVTVYRLAQGQRCAFPGPKVYWLAAYGCQGKSDVPNDKWQEGGGSYMLEKCTEAAALRKAFPEALGGMNAAEEMEGRRVDATPGPTIDHEPTPARPTRAEAKPNTEQMRKDAYESDRAYRQTMSEQAPAAREHVDDDTGEVTDANDSEPESGPKTAATPPSEPHPPAQDQAASKGDSDTHAETAGTLVKKIKGAGSLKTMNAVIGEYAQEMDTLRNEAPALYEGVQKEIADKKAWFAR